MQWEKHRQIGVFYSEGSAEKIASLGKLVNFFL
jgi:hypothetical protein